MVASSVSYTLQMCDENKITLKVVACFQKAVQERKIIMELSTEANNEEKVVNIIATNI